MYSNQRMTVGDTQGNPSYAPPFQSAFDSQALTIQNGMEMIPSSRHSAQTHNYWVPVKDPMVQQSTTLLKNPLQTNNSLQPAPKETKSAVFEACKQQITVTRIIGVMIGLILAGIPLAVMVTLYLQPATTTAAPGSTTVNPAASTSSLANALPYQCTVYSSNSDSTRNVNYYCGACYCDGLSGWYRFTGAAGTRLATSPPSTNYCGASYVGWFNGTLPTTVGATSIGTGCVNVNGALCQVSYSIPAVLATNCNGFYVFYLSPFPYCYTRYCTV